jgi:hypothetical protein
MPNEIPARTAVLYMRVTGLTVGDRHWSVTGRGEFVHKTPAIPLPAPTGSWRDQVADASNVATTATFTFTPDAKQADLALAILAHTPGTLCAVGATLYDQRPVSVMLTGYDLDVCEPAVMRWHATRLANDPVVVRFGEVNYAKPA